MSGFLKSENFHNRETLGKSVLMGDKNKYSLNYIFSDMASHCKHIV